MKKHKILLLALSSSLLVSACGGNSNPTSSSESGDGSSEIETLTLNKTSFALTVGQTFQLTASKPSASFSSASPDIASVDENGLVTGVSLGSAIITASFGEAKAYAKVTVTDEAQYVLSISFPSSSLALYEEDRFSFLPSVSFGGVNIKEATIEYGSSDPSVVAYVGGELTALKKGSARVYAKASYDGYSDVVYANVEVLAVTTSLSPSFKTRNVVVGEEGLALSFILMKGNEETALTSPVSYSVDKEDLAIVENGVLIGKKKGLVSLTASTTYDGEEFSTTLLITINERVSVSFYDDDTLLKTYDILNGQSVKLDVDNPTKPGYVFRNYVDEGNNIYSEETIFEENATFKATWLANQGEVSGATETTVKAINLENVSCPDSSGGVEDDSGARIHLQKDGVLSYDITLPSFDYNSAYRVDFIFNNNYGDKGWGTIKAGDGAFAYSSVNTFIVNAYVISDGVNASLYIQDKLLYTYDEDVSSGKKGLTFTFDRTTFDTTYQELFIGDFKTYLYDYRGAMEKAVASIPADPSTLSENEAATILKTYLEAASYLTPYESANLAEDAKISALRARFDGSKFALFAFPASGNLTFESVGAVGIHTDGLGFGWIADKVGESFLVVNFQDRGVAKGTTQYIEFPKINYALYSSVSFKAFHAYSGASVKVDGSDLISSTLDTSVYDIVISTSKGKTSISCGSVSFELDQSVAKGKKALRFDVTRDRELNGWYDAFGFTSFVGAF